jgi:putative two-component system response regulator
MHSTILLADQDPSSREGWEVLLRDQGYSVFSVTSGEELLNSCPRIRPDLVLINASSPDFCAPDICLQLKTDPRNHLTPVILIAGLSNASDSAPAIVAGADDVWAGSPSRWELLNRLNSLLQIKAYIDEQACSVITTLAQSIEARDPNTKGRGERLVILAMRLGTSLEMSACELEALRVATLLRDIGKVTIPDSILLKPGCLTLEERAIMEQHPIEGERICLPLKMLRDVLPLIRHHHERIDGSGYPDGLRRSIIPFGARVLQIVDIFDALTTDRVYRKAVGVAKALTIMYEEAAEGRLEDKLVNQFASFMAVQPRSYVRARSSQSRDLKFG